MNIQHHLVKYKFLYYGWMTAAQEIFLFIWLTKWEKIHGSEFRPYRTVIQTLKYF